ncbi:MAG: hypothetical protein JWQ94_2535 [Tardiphaga sp.]|nr:hypothetical protein [Tardiphaga sp.]
MGYARNTCGEEGSKCLVLLFRYDRMTKSRL